MLYSHLEAVFAWVSSYTFQEEAIALRGMNLTVLMYSFPGAILNCSLGTRDVVYFCCRVLDAGWGALLTLAGFLLAARGFLLTGFGCTFGGGGGPPLNWAQSISRSFIANMALPKLTPEGLCFPSFFIDFYILGDRGYEVQNSDTFCHKKTHSIALYLYHQILPPFQIFTAHYLIEQTFMITFSMSPAWQNPFFFKVILRLRQSQRLFTHPNNPSCKLLSFPFQIIQKMGNDNQENKNLNGLGDVEHGPISEANRECRDVICLILFVGMLGAMVYMSAYGFSNGNTTKIFRATDSNAVVCGDPSGPAANYPYAYFYNPTTMDLSNRYCVTECPYFSNGALTTLSCYGQASCTYAVTVTSSGTYSTNPSSTSQIIGYETTSMIDRVCIPSSTVFSGVFYSYISTFSTYLNQGDFSSLITDMENNWKWILAALGGAVLISFIFMYTLKCLAGLIVWTSVVGIVLVFAAAGLIFLYNAGVLTSVSSYTGYLSIPTLSGGTSTQYQIYGYISLGISGFLLLMLVCCFSRIRVAVAVCKAAGQFVSHTCSIVLVPIFQTILTLCTWGACLIVLVYLVSCATFTSSSGSVFTSISNYGDSSLIQFYVFVFGTLWCNAFIQAMGIFVIASACCMWYYSHGPGQSPNFPILTSYKMVFRYHFGSLAFGSLILAIVQFLQLAVEAFKKQAESSGANQSKAFEYVINCLRCCLACVERIVQFINKTAYIQIALRGKGFCESAKNGFEMAWSNPMRFAVVNGVGEIIMFLGKLMIAAGTTFAFYCAITYISSIKSNILQPIYLLLVVFIISFAVGMLFMAVYSIAMDTILQCFIVDETTQKEKGGKAALYAPAEIAELIDTAD